MRLVLETTQAMYLDITESGSDQLKVTTKIDGIDNQEIVDAGSEGLDFYNTSNVQVGKLRFHK